MLTNPAAANNYREETTLMSLSPGFNLPSESAGFCSTALIYQLSLMLTNPAAANNYSEETTLMSLSPGFNLPSESVGFCSTTLI